MSSVRLNLDLDDNQTDQTIGKTLQDLVDGSTDPLTAARVITNAIAADNQTKTDRWNATPAAERQAIVDSRTFPNGAGLQGMVNEDYAYKMGMQIPFDHPGQDRVIQMLQELQKMPRQTVYQENGERGLRAVTMWNFSPTDRSCYMKQWLWEMTYAHFPYDMPDEEFLSGKRDGTPESLLNYSAFLARLLASGIQAITDSCPLDSYGAFTKRMPWVKPLADPLESARAYEPAASAAAVWMIYSGDAMYEMCEKEAMFGIFEGGKYNHAKWELWKKKFNGLVSDERYTQRCRDFATQALDVMAKCEAEGPKNFMIDHYDMLTKEDRERDEDDELEEEDEEEETEEAARSDAEQEVERSETGAHTSKDA